MRKTSVLTVIAVWVPIAGCSDPSPQPVPRTVPKFRVAGRVQPVERVSLGPGTIALLVSAGSVPTLFRERAALATAQVTTSNLWPYSGFQRAIDDLQKAKVLSAALAGPDGRFEFSEPVPAGEYIVTIGVPILHDPGVGKVVPREWPSHLVTEMVVKLLNREFTVPARSAWVLKLSIVNSDRLDVDLSNMDRVVWPRFRPSNEQLTAIRTKSAHLDSLRKKLEAAEKLFRVADAKARQTGQPLEVKKAREKEADFTQQNADFQKSAEELDRYLEQLMGG